MILTNRNIKIKLKRKEKKDQTTCINPAIINPTDNFPVPANWFNVIDNMERTPSASMGEKSTGPILVKEKRRNQFRNGSQMEARNLPADENLSAGDQDKSI